MWVLFGAYTLQTKFLPYKDDVLNQLEALSLLSLYITQSMSMLYDTAGEQLSTPVSAGLIVLNAGMMLRFGVVYVKAKITERRDACIAPKQSKTTQGNKIFSNLVASARRRWRKASKPILR